MSMADVAQLVRALVCGTRCRRFESGYPPQNKKVAVGDFFILRKDRMRTGEGSRSNRRKKVYGSTPFARSAILQGDEVIRSSAPE